LMSWTVDGSQHNSSSTKILIFHEFLGMLMFLLSRVLEELGKAFEGYVITIVVRALQEKINNLLQFNFTKVTIKF
jgi:hypothetical protein